MIQQIRDTIGEQQQHLVSVSDISAVPQHSGTCKMPPEANSIYALLRKGFCLVVQPSQFDILQSHQNASAFDGYEMVSWTQLYSYSQHI